MSAIEMSTPKIPNRSVGKAPLIVIVGPTAVGKTDISIEVARRLDGEIVSADSRLFYRGMDIGTAKPDPNKLFIVPHHLIDITDPRETWSLALFQEAAREAINSIHARGRLPFLVGGTGQYIRAVIQGWSPPAAVDFQLRGNLESLAETKGSLWLHEQLRILDPISAEHIDPRNVRRTIRAVEVILSTGRKYSEQRTQFGHPYHLLTIGLTLPRPELYQRVDARIESMFSAGFIEEVRKLIEKGCTTDTPSMSAIGYREAMAILDGRISLEEAKGMMRRMTRIYIRRQANWFKSTDPNISWFYAGANSLDIIEKRIREFLVEE